MTQISGDRAIAAAVSESTYGTDAIDAGPPSSYLAFRAINIQPIVTPIESPRATFSASGEKHCVVKSHQDVTWELPFTAPAAAGVSPAWGALLRASGFKQTIVADTSVTFTPNTSNDMTDTPSATLWKYLLGLEEATAYLFKARGYRGNATINLTIGDEARITGAGVALFDAAPTSTVAKPSAPSAYEGAGCMIVTTLSLSDGTVTYPVESLEIQSNWAVTEQRTGEAGKGTLAKVLLTRPMSGGRMIGSTRLVDGKTAYQSVVTKWQAGTQFALTATITDGTRTITLSAPNVQFGQPAASAEGVYKHDLPLYFNRGTSGDDELSIAIT
jgi:hypothetical protein